VLLLLAGTHRLDSSADFDPCKGVPLPLASGGGGGGTFSGQAVLLGLDVSHVIHELLLRKLRLPVAAYDRRMRRKKFPQRRRWAVRTPLQHLVWIVLGMFSYANEETENVDGTHPLIVVAIRSMAGRGIPTPIDRKNAYIWCRPHGGAMKTRRLVGGGYGRGGISDPNLPPVAEDGGTVDVELGDFLSACTRKRNPPASLRCV